MYNLTVYVKDNCGACDLVLNWFLENRVAVTEVINVDLGENSGALDMLRDRGFMQFPVVSLNHFNSITFTGFNLEKMEQLKEVIDRRVIFHDRLDNASKRS